METDFRYDDSIKNRGDRYETAEGKTGIRKTACEKCFLCIHGSIFFNSRSCNAKRQYAETGRGIPKEEILLRYTFRRRENESEKEACSNMHLAEPGAPDRVRGNCGDNASESLRI